MKSAVKVVFDLPAEVLDGFKPRDGFAVNEPLIIVRSGSVGTVIE